MTKFRVVLDRKMTIWHRTKFDSIEADSLEEAQKLALKYDEGQSDAINEGAVHIDTEYLYDTAEAMTVAENYAAGSNEHLLAGTGLLETENLDSWAVVEFEENLNYKENDNT